MSEVQTWIVQQCNVYGACTVRERRFKQEFERDGVVDENEVMEFCAANQLVFNFVTEKAQYVFEKVT